MWETGMGNGMGYGSGMLVNGSFGIVIILLLVVIAVMFLKKQ